jgi:hypothetical protein
VTAVKPADVRRDVTERFAPGTLLAGRYRIISPLGKGGMGEVYRADDIRLGQPVALKFLPQALAADRERLERLVDEVRIGRQISHPNVCRLYDIAEAEGHHFLVMEYVDGEDLASLLRRIGRLPGDKALQVARGLCAGLAEAHDKGVIHRDLKPANVMIDGHGHARIADFGLAALARDGVTDASGTPQYMAPEQLTGGVASLRSDVYALGLVLHEMLTGKRVFEAKSVGEIRALHAETKPPSLSSSATDVDPSFERVVMRCLARDPNDRPASARVVLASLPGGDALQAALLAGETPSPQMVAAAGKVGDLRPAVAWAYLIAGLLGLLLIPLVGAHVALVRHLPKPPEILADRAKDVLTRLGYPEAAVDRAYGFTQDSRFLDHVRKNISLATQREMLRTARPGPLLFFYRESAIPLVSTSWIPRGAWAGPSELGGVSWNAPPLDVPGMTLVFLDPLGRLTSFVAVPPLYHSDPGPGPNPDWSLALAEAGFDPNLLKPSASHWAAPVDSDRRAAWEGTLPGQEDLIFHIEAAAYRGRLVYFRMRGPWVQPPPNGAAVSRTSLVDTALTVFALVMGALAGLWAQRNLRSGRGDLRGARRLAAFTFANLALTLLVAADHTVTAVAEFSLLVLIAGQALVGTWFLWAFYMALEPFVRRRWPHTLIAWNRLAAGRFRDPLIGRDVLIGALGGMALVLAHYLDLASLLLGRAPAMPSGIVTPNRPREMAQLFFLSAFAGVFFSIASLFILSLLQALVRRAWLARLLLFLVVVAAAFRGADPLVHSVKGAIVGAVIVLVLVRVGLLAFATLLFTYVVLRYGGLTLDWSAWYAGPSFAVVGFFAALLVAAFYTSLGGKPLFGKTLLDD